MVPPFLACGTPIRSSILLALLKPVAGLEGGADSSPNPAAPGASCSLGGIGEAVLEAEAETFEPGESVGAAAGGPVTLMGGVAVLGSGGTGGTSVSFLIVGAADALTALEGGPLGGGGRGASDAAGASPAFLFTHFFKSLS